MEITQNALVQFAVLMDMTGLFRRRREHAVVYLLRQCHGHAIMCMRHPKNMLSPEVPPTELRRNKAVSCSSKQHVPVAMGVANGVRIYHFNAADVLTNYFCFHTCDSSHSLSPQHCLFVSIIVDSMAVLWE